jgi:hypothetical protein
VGQDGEEFGEHDRAESAFTEMPSHAEIFQPISMTEISLFILYSPIHTLHHTQRHASDQGDIRIPAADS